MAAKQDLNPFGGDNETDKRIPIQKPEDPNEPEISLGAPETEEEDDEPAVDDEPGLSRKEKKRNRWQEHKDRADAKEKELIAERAARAAETAALSAQVAQAIEQARQALEFSKSQQPQKQQVDPLDVTEKQIDNERLNLLKEFELRQADTKNPMTREERQKYEERAQEIENKKIDVRAERRARSMAPQQQQQQQVDPRTAAIQAHLAMQHPEVAGNQAALAYAEGELRKLVARGKPYDLNTVSEALDTTERELRLGKHKDRREPDPTLKDKLQGPAKGAVAGGTEMPKSIKMTRGLQKLADRAYSHIKDPNVRYTKWAKEVGAKLVADGVDLSEYR